MSPSCFLTSVHFLLLSICFIDFRQVCNERIPGSLLSHIPKPLRGRESETPPWGSQARRRKPPLQLLATVEPGTQPVEFPWCLYCTWPLGGGIPKLRISVWFKREKDIRKKRKTFMKKIENFVLPRRQFFPPINLQITEELFQETLWLSYLSKHRIELLIVSACANLQS